MAETQDLYELVGDKPGTGITREFWLTMEPAIVAVNEDPEHRHRIKVIIPSIDENDVCQKWIDRLVWWTGAPGYGDCHIPEIGSEVALVGMRGDKHHLFYIARFNEDFVVPKDFWGPADTRGFRTDGDYKSIVELDHFMKAGRFLMESDASFRIVAPGGFFVNGKRVDSE
jgi:type VI secretion system (T6SS) baseplate-like injector VgrG